MENLISHLISKPSIKAVYFNENNEWLFYPRAKFPIVKTREEVLGMSTPKEVKRTAAELVELILNATSVAEIDEIVGNDTRKTVLATAETKKLEFN